MDRIAMLQAEQKERTKPITGEDMKVFITDFPFLSKVLFNQIKGGQPIDHDSYYLNKAEERLQCCANCKAGSGCFEIGAMHNNGEPLEVKDPGIIPASINDSGTIVYRDCAIWKEQKRQKALMDIGVPKIFFNADFNKFKAATEGQKKAVTACKNFINAICNGEQTRGLFFSGPFGTGKTHLSAAIINELQARGVKDLRFEVVPKLLAITRKEMQKKDGDICKLDLLMTRLEE